MSTTDRLDQATRRANTVDDLAAEGRNYGDDYTAALEASAADVPALVNAVQAVLSVLRDWHADITPGHSAVDDPADCWECRRISTPIEEALA